MSPRPDDQHLLPIPPRRPWRMGWFLAILAIGPAAGGWWWHARDRDRTPAGSDASSRIPPGGAWTGGRGRGAVDLPTPVAVATARTSDVEIAIDALGAVTSLGTVTVKTQIAGPMTKVAFTEGQMVQAGDFLAQIDPRSFEFALEQYRGQLARDQAVLAGAELDLARYRTLASEDSIARQQVDTQESLVQQYRASVATDQSLVHTAELNVGNCRITAPVGGRIGLRQVDVGNYVQTGDSTGIAVITQVKPISVIFSLPEDQLPVVVHRLHAGAELPVTIFDRSQTTHLATGRLATMDNQIDPTTGTVKFRALFANEDESLFPNQFVNARLQVEVLHGATVIPSAAVQRGLPGTFVYLVAKAPGDGRPDQVRSAAGDPSQAMDRVPSAPGSSSPGGPPGGPTPRPGGRSSGAPGSGTQATVSIRPITLGPASGDLVAVSEGLEPGDQVVVDGSDRLKEGAAVLVQPAGPDAGSPGDRLHGQGHLEGRDGGPAAASRPAGRPRAGGGGDGAAGAGAVDQAGAPTGGWRAGPAPGTVDAAPVDDQGRAAGGDTTAGHRRRRHPPVDGDVPRLPDGDPRGTAPGMAR